MSFWPGLMPSFAQSASSLSMPPLTMIFCRSGATPAAEVCFGRNVGRHNSRRGREQDGASKVAQASKDAIYWPVRVRHTCQREELRFEHQRGLLRINLDVLEKLLLPFDVHFESHVADGVWQTGKSNDTGEAATSSPQLPHAMQMWRVLLTRSSF